MGCIQIIDRASRYDKLPLHVQFRLGTSRFHEVEPGNADTEGSPFFRCQFSIPIQTREIPSRLKEMYQTIIIDAWNQRYSVHILATMIEPRFAYRKKITLLDTTIFASLTCH